MINVNYTTRKRVGISIILYLCIILPTALRTDGGGGGLHFLTLINAHVITIIFSPRKNEIYVPFLFPLIGTYILLLYVKRFRQILFTNRIAMAQKRIYLMSVQIDEKKF